MNRQWPNSKIPTVRKLNALVYRAYPPRRDKHGSWMYGRLFFYSDGDFPRWTLDGMTPVGPACVLHMLEDKGFNVKKFDAYFRRLKHRLDAKTKRRLELRECAAKKLTPAERQACAL